MSVSNSLEEDRKENGKERGGGEGWIPGEDVVCDGCDAVFVTEGEAEFEHQGCFS